MALEWPAAPCTLPTNIDVELTSEVDDFRVSPGSLDWFKGKIAGTSHISWANLWFPLDFPLSQAIDRFFSNPFLYVYP